jgi:hypothetical protein
MEPKNIRQKHGQYGPEYEIQQALITFMERRDWLIKATHGNLFQSGLP